VLPQKLAGKAVSVITATHNRYATLRDAIASIELQDCDRALFELVVVDNSTDSAGREAFIADLDILCHHRYIVEPIPGVSRAVNIGVQAASGEIIAFLDDDARAGPGWIAQVIRTFAEQPEAGVIGGPLIPIWPTARPAWLHPWLEGYLSILDLGPERRPLAEHEWLARTNMAVRRPVLIEAGMFDERIGRIGGLLLSNEELPFCDKVRALGHHVIYEPKLEVHHHVHADRLSEAWIRRRVFWQTISELFCDLGAPEPSFDAAVGRVLDYLSALPPKARGIAGLFMDVDDPALFHQQTLALRTMVRLLATDARDWRQFLTPTAG